MIGYFTVVACMFFCHIIDDFILQAPCLVMLKQKSYWKEACPKEIFDRLYKHDYLIALLIHGFSWSFSIQLPFLILFWFMVPPVFLILLISNTIIHAYIDHLKANKLKINLIQDQLLHLLQILYTALILANTAVG